MNFSFNIVVSSFRTIAWFLFYHYAFSFQDFARYGFGHQAQETEVYLSFKEAAKGATKG